MFDITKLYNYYSNNFDDFFKDDELREMKDEVFIYILNEISIGLTENKKSYDMMEDIANNARQYYHDSYYESSGNEILESEEDIYDFLYQYNIVDEVYDYLEPIKKNYLYSNNILVFWNEDFIVNLKIENGKTYLEINNENIVKYTNCFDLHNNSKLATIKKNTLVDLGNEFILYKSVIDEKFKDHFFYLVEIYLFLKTKDINQFINDYNVFIEVELYSKFNKTFSKLDIEDLKEVFKILNRPVINKIIFSGWMRESLKIRSTHV